jgi:uncharacterized protein YvpB
MTNTANLAPGSNPKITTPPVYSGPKEVLVGKPVVLKGSYDPARISKITIKAEDRFDLDVTMNAGTWQINMAKGFSTAGSRWLRFKGLDKAGKEVESRVFYITVSRDPLTVGQALTLKVVKDTFFKVNLQDSAKLNAQQKVMVKAGQTFTVNRYGSIDGHLKLELAQKIEPIGEFGYFFAEHVQLSKGAQVLRFSVDDVPNTPAAGTQMLVTTTTFLKKSAEDSAALAEGQRTQLMQGQTIAINGYACLNGHFRVSLAQPIAGFGDSGFIFWRHVRLTRNGKEIPFDPDALSARILQTTVLKKQPKDAATLPASDKVTVNAGDVIGVSSYAIDDGHIRLSTTEELPNFGNTGYIAPNFVQMQQGGKAFNPMPPRVELNVPFFSQRDNPRMYWSTCNVTSIAMVFYYYGVRSKDGGQLEDEMLQWCLDRYGAGSQTDHSVLVKLIEAYGFESNFSTTRKWQDIKDELVNRRPVVIAGYFTHGGHIITIMGYTPQGFIVQDPWGDGYYGYASTEGRKLLYPYNYMTEMCGRDGDVWAHFIRKR